MLEGTAPNSGTSSANETVRPPTRSANRNRSLVDRADPSSEDLLLPTLEEGITLLDVESDRGVPIVQSLVLDHLLLNDGPAFWVDSDGHATTTRMARIAPSQRLLRRIHVARGFTAAQHYSAVCDLPTATDQYSRNATSETGSRRAEKSGDRGADVSPRTPSLVVAPALDAQYRADDALGDDHARTLQARVLARLGAVARTHDVPVLVSRSKVDEFAASIETAADHRLRCERTRMGPRLIGDEFETLLYPVGDGAYYQTTFAYWRQLLSARATQVGVTPVTPTRPASPNESVGTGTTTSGSTATFTADPLLDAWAGPGVGGR